MPGNVIKKTRTSNVPLVPISKLIVLVHPFYSLVELQNFNDHGIKNVTRRPLDEFPSRNIRTLGVLWARKMKEAADDPHAVVVWLDYSDRKNYSDAKAFPAIARLNETTNMMIRFVSKNLGRRFFVLKSPNGEIDATQLRARFIQRGFRVPRRVHGEVFGEYLNECVDNAVRVLQSYPHNPWGSTPGAREMAKKAAKMSNIKLNSGLTVHWWGNENWTEGKPTRPFDVASARSLGSIFHDLRANAKALGVLKKRTRK